MKWNLSDPPRAVPPMVRLRLLPGGPRIDENGNVRAGGLVAALMTLIIPGVSIVGHGWYIVQRLL